MPNKLRLDIRFEGPFKGLVTRDLLRRTIRQTLIAAGVSGASEVGLVIAGDETVHSLNRQYRGIDDTTDVLSFALQERSKENDHDFVLPPDSVKHLGEVIISYIQAVSQAGEQGQSLEQEITFLVIHGVLHLLGYDHQNPEEERAMVDLQTKVVAALQE